MPNSPYKIMIAAGEPSGDLHAAGLIKALHSNKHYDGKSFDCFGMGLEKMKDAGLRQLVNAKNLSLIGIFEVLIHYPNIKRAYRRLVNAMKEESPDLLVLIDYPEFNLRLALAARKLGIKTLFYISPQVWAWRSKRVKKIAHCIDMMAVIFPFEEKIYHDAGVPVRYVGHPFVDQISHDLSPTISRSNTKNILLLPGSRTIEIRRLLPILCRSAVKIKNQMPSVHFSLLLAPGIPATLIEKYLQKYQIKCELIDENSDSAMRDSDLAITASGSASLQLALHETPMIIIYKVSWLTYIFLKKLIKIPYIGLVNIILGKKIAPELIQHDANADAICREVFLLLENKNRIQQIKRDLHEIKKILGPSGATKKIADLVREMVGANKCFTKQKIAPDIR